MIPDGSYREELDEEIEYGDQTTSAENTEAETTDADKHSRRKPRLGWSRDRSTSESRVNQMFSFSDKGANKLQKKRPKDDSWTNSPVASLGSEASPSERGLVGRLSPP